METGWLLDDGRMCVGMTAFGTAMTTYTDAAAIRFARRQDAENMRSVFIELGMRAEMENCTAVEHAWEAQA